MAAQDQKVEFLFAAQVSGQEQLKKLTDAVDNLRKEMEALKSAGGAVGAGLGAVEGAARKSGKGFDEASKAIRNHRQGVQQAGMQINDFVTSVSTGASPVQAFNQQIGQLGYAMGMMGGTAGKIGNFLAGPWSILVIGASMAVGFLWDTMGKAPEVNEEFASALSRSRDALFDYQVTIAKTREAVLELYQTKLAGLQFEFQKSATDAGKFGRKVQDSKKILDNWSSTPAWKVGVAMYENATATTKFNEAQTKTLDINTEMIQLQNTLAQMRKRHASEDSAASAKALRAAESAAKKLENEREAAREKEAKSIESFMEKIGKVGMKEIPAYQRQIAELEKDFMELSEVGQEATIAPFRAAVESIEMSQYGQMLKADAKNAQDMIKDVLSNTDGAPVSKSMEDIIARNEEVKKSFEAIGNSVSDAFKGMLTGAASWKDGMRSLIASVIDQLWKLFVVQKIVGFISGALGGTGQTSGLGGVAEPAWNMPMGGFKLETPAIQPFNFSGPRAYGGSVNSNKSYMVGERGPELFIPGGNGTIIPNSNMRGGGGGSPISISVDARGSNDPAAVRAQVQQGILEAAPAIIAAAESRTIAGLRRPRLGGAMQ